MEAKIPSHWEGLKKIFNSLHPGIDSEILDFIAVLNILHYHAVGLSSSSISRVLEYGEEYIDLAILVFLRTPPHKEDLDINPLLIYDRVSTKDEFILEVKLFSEYDDETIVGFYKSVQRFLEIKEKVEDYYAKS